MSEERKRGGLVPMLMTAVIGAGTAFGVSWLDPFGSGEAAAHAPAEEGHTDEARPPAPPAKPFLLDPLVVSLTDPDGARRRAPRLRVVVAVVAEETAAGDLSADDPVLRDGFTAAARRLGAETLAGPDGLEALRAAFLAHARETLGEEAVRGVLVTDYVMS